MRKSLLAGTAAGAVGCVALDASGYLDIVIRARPASGVPAEAAGVVAERAGVKLAAEGGSSERANNRKSGLGGLFGHGIGVGIGVAYGLLRPAMPWLPGPAAAVGLGLAAMAASDVPLVALGVTDPRTWGPSGWASDVVPHLVYGFATALTFDALSSRAAARS
jgi:hypothetical protein